MTMVFFAALLALGGNGQAGTATPASAVAPVALSLVDDRLSTLKTHPITVARDRAYKRSMRYEAWSLSDVLSLLPGVESLARRDDMAITFVGSDGYRATEPLTAIWNDRTRGHIALRDVRAGAREWKPIRVGKSLVTPAPFYLVWTGPDDRSLPWPYQLVRIEIAPLTETFAHALPADPAARAGFDVFRANCLSCHSVNLSGGSVGPELNVPRNVTEYWVPEELPHYIRNAGGYHFHARMPAFDSLSDQQIDAVVRYLKAMKTEKVCRSADDCERFARGAKN